MAAATIALLTAGTMLVVGRGDQEPGDPGFRGAIAPSGQPAASFVLRDQDGKKVSAASLRGSPVVLTFLYTTCEDTCPTTAQQIRGALDRLDPGIPALAVAVDPPNDTPLRARRFLARQGLTGRMSFLLGSRDELSPVWRRYGVRPQEDGIDHSARVVLLDTEGRPAVAWPVEQLTPEGLAHDLSLLGAGRRPAT